MDNTLQNYLTINSDQNRKVIRIFVQQSDYEYPDQEDHTYVIQRDLLYNKTHTEEQVHLQGPNIAYSLQENIGKSIQIPQKCKNTSIFHNFQKQLCSFLKKIIKINQQQIKILPSGKCVLYLWKNFLKICTPTKEKLYSIFGINIRNKQSKIKSKITKKQKQMHRYSLEEVERGQYKLRQMIIAQCNVISKNQVLRNCKMRNIDSFYAYFKLFVEDLIYFYKVKPMNRARLMLQSSLRVHTEK